MIKSTYKFKYALIDISNIFRRNYEIQVKTLNSIDMQNIYRETIVHTLISINKIERELLTDNHTIYFLFDNPTHKKNIRYELSEEYKNNRKKLPEDYYKAIDHLALILQYRNDNNYLVRTIFLEADDNVLPILQKIKESDKINNVLLCSADFDYARSISKNVYWYNFNEVIGIELFKEKHGFIPTESSVTLYKTIKGDKSDCIQIGVLDIHLKTILPLIETYKDIYALLGDIENTSLSDKWKKEFKKNEKQLRLNYMLVDYIRTTYNEIDEYVVKTKFSALMLKDLYNSITTDIKSIDKRDLFEVTVKKSSDDFFDSIKLERL